MSRDSLFFLQKIAEAGMPLLVFLAVFAAGLALRKVIFARLGRWAKNTRTEIDDLIIESVRGPFLIWFVMLGLYFALRSSRLPEELVRISGRLLMVLGIFSVTCVLASMTSRFIKMHSTRLETALPVTSLTQNISRIVIFCVGFLVILNSLGVSIAPILATLGVGGLAVALALQDTLSNLFAGFHVIASRQIKIGDYVRIESGEEGYVIDIGWRTTKIKMLSNNVVLVPNEKLAKSIVTNYYLPDREMAVLVNVGVHYNSDLGKVERVTAEVAQEVMREVGGGVPGFEPFIRYHTFGDFSIGFTVILRAREFVDQHLIRHEFIKRLHARYKKEGIVIPYPVRAVNTSQEKA